MPIIAKCPGCGKQLKVRDELVGKKLKCPRCGKTFDAMASGPSVAAPGNKPAIKKSSGPAISVSFGLIAGIAAVVLVIGAIVAFIFGPVKAKNEWEALGDKPRDDVESVVTHALQAYMSRHGGWNPRKPQGMPRASGDDVTFIWDMFVMSVPESVPFQGSSTEGGFKGQYFPKTGEVVADVGMGGLSIAGLGAVKEGSEKIHVVGRVKGGKTTTEVDGKPMEIYYPPVRDDE